jgi:stage IV sporulation protein FB
MKIGKVTVHAGFVLLVTVLVWLDQGGLLWIVCASAVLHELGHYIPLRLLGGRVSSMELTGGGVIMISTQPMNYKRELFTVLAGPFASLGFALLFSLTDGIMAGQMALAGMCLSHAIFNLLPMRGLDGGRALELILGTAGFTRTDTVLTVSTAITVTVLAAFCGYLAWRTQNLSLLLAMIYILMRR